MARHFLSVSALLLTSILGFASTAKAESAVGEVQFAGNVPGLCSFSNSVAGKLGLNGDGKGLGSNPDWYRGASTGLIDISCTGAATLTVADPVQLSGATNTIRNTAIIYTKAGMVNSPSGTYAPKSAILPAGFSQQAAHVDIDVSSENKISGGDYKYKVMITAAPN